jgi:hypothetical protein
MHEPTNAKELFSLILEHRDAILAVNRWSDDQQALAMQPPYKYDFSDPVIREARLVPSPCELEPSDPTMLYVEWSERRQELFEECVGRDFLESDRLRQTIATFGTHWKSTAFSTPRDFGIKSLSPVDLLESYLPMVTLRLHELGKSRDFARMRIVEGDNWIGFSIGVTDSGTLSVDLPKRPPSLIRRGYPVYEGDELLGTFGKQIESFRRASFIANRGMSEYVGRLGLTRPFDQMACALCSSLFWPQSLHPSDIARVGPPRYCFECHRLRSDVWRKIPLDLATRRTCALRGIELVHELTGMFPFKDLKRQSISHLEPELRDKWFLAQIFMPDRSAGELFGSWDTMLTEAKSIGFRPRRGRGGYVSASKCGHLCYSLGERTVCDQLHEMGVTHQKEPTYPSHKGLNPAERLRADWLVGDVWIELAGYPNDPTYMKKLMLKQDLAIELDLNHLILMPSDLRNIRTALESKGIVGSGEAKYPHEESIGELLALRPAVGRVLDETLLCRTCRKEFTRTRTRGRKPHECQSCREISHKM